MSPSPTPLSLCSQLLLAIHRQQHKVASWEADDASLKSGAEENPHNAKHRTDAYTSRDHGQLSLGGL